MTVVNYEDCPVLRAVVPVRRVVHSGTWRLSRRLIQGLESVLHPTKIDTICLSNAIQGTPEPIGQKCRRCVKERGAGEASRQSLDLS